MKRPLVLKLGGELLFTAGELRAWIRDREDVVGGASPLSPVASVPFVHA